jgi:hypothetical protein
MFDAMTLIVWSGQEFKNQILSMGTIFLKIQFLPHKGHISIKKASP